MGPTYVTSVLLTMASKRETAKVAEVELEPIVPGVWAAWAKRGDTAAVALTDEATPTTSAAAVKPVAAVSGA